QFLEPYGRRGVTRRAPVAPRAQRACGRNLGPVGDRTALELAEGEEALQEAFEPAADRREVVFVAACFGQPCRPAAARLVAPGVPGEERDLRRLLTVAHDVMQEEVVE